MATQHSVLLRPHKDLFWIGLGLAAFSIVLGSALDLTEINPFKPVIAGLLWSSFVSMLSPIAMAWRIRRQHRLVGTGITGDRPAFDKVYQHLRGPRLLGRLLVLVAIISLRVAVWSVDVTTSDVGKALAIAGFCAFGLLAPLGLLWLHRVSLAGDLLSVTGWRSFHGHRAKVGFGAQALWLEDAEQPTQVLLGMPISFRARSAVGPFYVAGPNTGPFAVCDPKGTFAVTRTRRFPKRLVGLRRRTGRLDVAQG